MTSTTGPAPRERRRRAGLAQWAVLGLRWRLTIYLGVALFLLLSAFGLLSLQAMGQARQILFSQQIRVVLAMAGGLEREFDHISADVHSHLPVVPPPALAPRALASLQEHLGQLENLGYFRVASVRLVSADGSVLAAFPANTPALEETLPPIEVVRQAVTGGTTVVTFSRLPMEGKRPFAAVVVPLLPFLGSSEGAALVADTVGLGAISLAGPPPEAGPDHGAEAQRDGGQYEVEVLAPDGTILATSEGEELLGTVSYHYEYMKEYLENRRTGAVVHWGGSGKVTHIAGVVPVGEAPFFLVTEEPLGLLLDWPRQVRNQGVLLGAIAALIVLGLGAIITQQIVRPVVSLRRATAEIKGGNLEAPVRIRAQGELARLVEEVDSMRQRLRETLASLDGLNRSLGDQVQERTQQLRSVVSRLMQAQEEERRRVARDLHDETAQGLTALGVLLDEAALKAEAGGGGTVGSIRAARAQVSRLVAETRRLAYALRPSVLDDAGLVPALRWCAEAYLEPVGIRASLETPGAELRLPEPVEVALFRVAQEAVGNIAKHARASHAWISLEFGGAWATLTVRDDGVGFDVRQTMDAEGRPGPGGFGLAGMRERIDLLGGRLHVASQPGQGTTVTAYIPARRWQEETP